MSPSSTFVKMAGVYSDRVRDLFVPSDKPSSERGGQRPLSYDDLAVQARALAPISQQLTREAEIELAAWMRASGSSAATSLMAKSLTDLQVSAHLLQAAMDQEKEYEFAGERARRECKL